MSLQTARKQGLGPGMLQGPSSSKRMRRRSSRRSSSKTGDMLMIVKMVRTHVLFRLIVIGGGLNLSDG